MHDTSAAGDGYARLIDEAAAYYARTLREHGATPRGADWNGAESQSLRFRELLRVLPATPTGAASPVPSPSLCDLGCGYGALLDHVHALGLSLRYTGVDIVASMIDEARALHREHDAVRWLHADAPDGLHDYVVASGIFNVRGDADDASWLGHVLRIVDRMHDHSRRGFAFNCLTTSSDLDRRRPHLYYADPAAMLTHCLNRYSRHVAVLQDYGLYEFTVIVRKEPP